MAPEIFRHALDTLATLADVRYRLTSGNKHAPAETVAKLDEMIVGLVDALHETKGQVK